VDLIQFCPLLEKLGKAEICEFVGFVLNEYVGGFEVSVDDGVLMQVAIAGDELLDYDEGLSLRHLLALFEDLLE